VPRAGNPDAVAMLRHMMEDRVPFVRQASCIGLAMVFMLRNDAQEPKVCHLEWHWPTTKRLPWSRLSKESGE